jgi:AraC-like DNA-binding protein
MTQEKFYIEREIGPAIKLVLNQIEQMKLSPQFQNLFLIGKMYELFTLYFSEIENQTEHCPFLNDENEGKRIKEIKDYLLADFKNPPTIKQLCEKFSISEYHLKEGFKELYGTTVYGYLLDKKLEYALHKLEENQQMVKDISFEIGYENPSHFISAFKKKYGLTPKQYIKQFQ